MARCLICGSEVDSILVIGKHAICGNCEDAILNRTPNDKEYEELLAVFKPLSQEILASAEKTAETTEQGTIEREIKDEE